MVVVVVVVVVEAADRTVRTPHVYGRQRSNHRNEQKRVLLKRDTQHNRMLHVISTTTPPFNFNHHPPTCIILSTVGCGRCTAGL